MTRGRGVRDGGERTVTSEVIGQGGRGVDPDLAQSNVTVCRLSTKIEKTLIYYL